MNTNSNQTRRKWVTLQKVDAECWEQVGVGSQGHPIWELQADWLRVLYKGAFKTIRACAGPGLQPLQAVCFITPDDVFEVRLFSRLQAGCFYDSNWYMGATPPDRENIGHFGERRVQSNLADGNSNGPVANIIWTVSPDTDPGKLSPDDCNVRLFCADLDETIDLNLATMDLRYQENEQEQKMRLLPWQRLLSWYTRLRKLDKGAYRRMQKPLRKWLELSDSEQRIANLTERDVGLMQQDGLLPPYIAWLNNEEASQVTESISLQQSIANRADVIAQFATMMQMPNYSPIPQLLLQVDPRQLDIIDLQVFMTIGALREVHGFLEVETQRLLERRPDLKMAMQSPQGARQLQADPEIAALNAHPQALSEQQDQQDLMMRRSGNYGPTPRDITISTQMMMNMQGQQMAATMFGGGLGMSMSLLATLTAADQYLAVALADGPPWKLYKPYVC